MSQSVPFDPRGFETSVPFYARYRLGYPLLLVRRVIETAGLAPGDTVLDLGCEPGLLAIPFAAAGMTVTGVDPEPELSPDGRFTEIAEMEAVIARRDA